MFVCVCVFVCVCERERERELTKQYMFISREVLDSYKMQIYATQNYLQAAAYKIS